MVDHPARGTFEPVPSAKRAAQVSVATELPPISDAAALAVPVVEDRRAAGRPRCRRRAAGRRSASPAPPARPWRWPARTAERWSLWESGGTAAVDATLVRDLAADFARAVPQHLSLAVELPDRPGALPGPFAQVGRRGRAAGAVALLRRHRRRRADPDLSHARGARRGGRRGPRRARPCGEAVARAAAISRDLSNCPATTLTAARMAEVAAGARAGRRARGRGLRRGRADRDGLRRHPRRQPGQRRRAAADQAELSPRRPGRTSRPGRQGGHVRLRRHQPQAERRVACPDEERHDRRRCHPRGDDRPAGPRVSGVPSRRTSAAPTTCPPARR